MARVRGSRVSLTIPPGLEQRLASAPKVTRELARVVDEIASLADATVPVRSGALKESQRVEVILTPKGAVGVIAYTAFYAHMVHNGTVHATANPWLLNAALAVMVGQRRETAA